MRTTITDRKIATFNNWNITGFSADITSANDYFPFGSEMPGRSYNSGEYRYGFNGKEKDDEVKGTGNSYDFGARIYDSRLGRFLSLDPAAINYPSMSNYHFVRNNPILRIDPTGKWDVVVHGYNNRLKYGYGVAILKNRNGEEVARYVVRLNGQHHNRMGESGDTPRGVYEIDKNMPWQSGGSTASYGPNDRLRLEGNHTGEIAESARIWIRLHGGRQGENDTRQEPNEPLQKTEGCIRCYDDDILNMKQLSELLEANDPLEAPGTVTVVDDMQEYRGMYYTPKDYFNIIDGITNSSNLTGGLMEAKSREDFINVLNTNTQNVNNAASTYSTEKGISETKKDY